MKKIILIIFSLSSSLYSMDLNTTIGVGTIGINMLDGLKMFQNTYISLIDIELYDRDSRLGLNSSILLDRANNITLEDQTTYLNLELYYNVYNFEEEITLGPYIDCTFFDNSSFNPTLQAGIKFNLFLPMFLDSDNFQIGTNAINSKLGYSILYREFTFLLNTDLTVYALFIFAQIYSFFNP